ncbi:hypothetical protein VFPPC_16771 [Pochonia chlamydosporia 170]|uniref:Uncharacterized protein n=1 Tax=Pochonia chlamydosporia 170 TaxID=1380566 RepID=A0A179F4L6_METCM|nr:hypothetical protein VFPPC_16771 [Pochonia chlamydosporia 170]OAQ60123.1 hypothetical protein VFPPC_16771 [Pochonia chlamydosporia 170]
MQNKRMLEWKNVTRQCAVLVKPFSREVERLTGFRVPSHEQLPKLEKLNKDPTYESWKRGSSFGKIKNKNNTVQSLT